MDPGFYLLIAAVVMFLCAIFTQGFKEPKTGLHEFAHNPESTDIVEHRYNRIRNFQRSCMWAGIALVGAAIAVFIIPHWDDILRNL